MTEVAEGAIPTQKSLDNQKFKYDAQRAAPLIYYEYGLGFDPKLLSGMRVLNFGSHYSNIVGDLKKRGIESQVVNVDLRHLPDHRGTIIQGDGRALPFNDNSFDVVLALLSTYQVPDEDKEQAYKELMRVGEIIHTGPVWGNEFRVIQRIAAKQGFEIVASQPYPGAWDIANNRKPFNFASTVDYDHYIQEHDASERIIPPRREEPGVASVLGKKLFVRQRGGSAVVLKRKQTQPSPATL